MNKITEEGFNVTDVCKLWKKYEETENIVRKQGSGQTTKLTNEIKILIKKKMKNEDETRLHYFHDE